MQISYTEIISLKYPDIVFYSPGDGFSYENIVLISGGPLPDKSVLDADIDGEVRNRVWLAIQEERTRRQTGGVFIQSVNKWFHSDQTSRIQQLGLVMMGNNMPNNINWKTMDGTFVIMTPALALSIFNAVATLDMTAFAVAEQHRANMIASPTPDTYNFSGLWPAIYEA